MAQVDVEHYKWQYLSRSRFVMYQKILDLLSNINFRNVLELGPGPGLLSHILRFLNRSVLTIDFDKNLKPNVLGDIRSLPFKRDSFDLVLASQILEHISYQDFLKIIQNINCISRKYFLFSVPYNQDHIEIYINFKIMKWLYFKGYLNGMLDKIFPIYFYFGKSRNISFPKHEEHFWEIGYKGYHISKVRNDIKQIFVILEEGRVPLAPYYYYFLCQKKV